VHPKIDLSGVVDISYKEDLNVSDIEIYPFFEENRTILPLKKENILRSGMVFGKKGLAYKFVLPVRDRRIINIMEIGVEPDQIEDINNINISPKAQFQIVIPLD